MGGTVTIDIGCWPPGPDYSELLAAEKLIGRKFKVFRERGGRGSLDTPAYKSGMVKAVAAGRKASLELDPRLGGSAPDDYVSYASVLSGRYDDLIHERAREVKALAGGAHLLELSSEANIPAHDSGSPADYQRYCAHVRRIFVAEGALNVLYATSLIWAEYAKGHGDDWIDPSVIQVAAADGYSKPATGRAKSFGQMFDPCRAFAQDRGLLWYVTETGCQEAPGDPTYKASWLMGALGYCKAISSKPLGVVYNNSADGEGGWPIDTSAAALSAFKIWAHDPVMTWTS